MSRCEKRQFCCFKSLISNVISFRSVSRASLLATGIISSLCFAISIKTHLSLILCPPFENTNGAAGLSKTTSAEFQQLSRPQQKHYLWEAHEKGIGPRALFRLTGVPYSIVQRATSAENEKRLQSGMVCESSPEDEEWYSYCSPDEFEPYPEC